jgi:hypothetical protein
MATDNVLRMSSKARQPESSSPSFLSLVMAAIPRQLARMWCGMHGHLILLHFEPNKLSLQCALCGYESEGWEVGRLPAPRRRVDNRVQSHHVHIERRRSLRAVPSGARMAS